MKKLKKLTLKETGKQIPVISTKEAEKLLGGTGNINEANTVQMDSSEITISESSTVPEG